MESIKGFFNEYRWLSNFHQLNHPILDDYQGVTYHYPTVEHAYQAMKTDSPHWRTRIMYAQTPYDAKRLGRAVPMRSNWDLIKDDIMLDLVRHKFYHSDKLKRQLIATNGAHLYEVNRWGDTYWGCDDFLEGENRLGEILMQVRDEVRDQS